MTTRYDGCITVDKTAKTVRVYRYVSYSNGQNNLLDNSTHKFDTVEDAMQFAERMHGHYKADGVSLVVTD